MRDEAKGVFRAVLEEVSPGLFQATYRGDANADESAGGTLLDGPHVVTDQHIGTEAAAVRSFVEALAQQRGYERVVWEQPSAD